jgi:Na+/H+ antiporter NhaD/arsenite permease-like protein
MTLFPIRSSSMPVSILRNGLRGGLAFLAALVLPAMAWASEGHSDGPHLGEILPLWSVIPFAGVLLSIALCPLLVPHFWHHHFPKVAAAWALLFAVPFIFGHGGTAVHEIAHIVLIDYIPFIILLWGLFTISGGILVKGSLVGTPALNTGILALGTVLASVMGTTGASMLLIRPLLRANASRSTKTHIVVFFIFLVSNIGGSLTPLGDPPLFLGFLHGVPFTWTFKLLPEFLTAAAILLSVFFVIDTKMHGKEAPSTAPAGTEPLAIDGGVNFLFLAGLLGAVLMSGTVHLGHFELGGIHLTGENLARDGIILVMGALSLKFTQPAAREGNGFTWGPIREVAFLFAGIFVTIIPALKILEAGEKGALAFVIRAAQEPWQFFWISGALSSFLDNAPTYLTFFNTALGKLHITEPMLRDYFAGKLTDPAVLSTFATFETFLKAIACGSVFMGANTYIGNAPNFMVKAIAEENEVTMPSFFGYMAWSVSLLIPTFIVLTFIFFR